MDNRDLETLQVWVPPDEVTPRIVACASTFGVWLKSQRKGKLVWAVADGPAEGAVDYEDYEFPAPEVNWTLCFGPNDASVEPFIKPGEDRITIPGLLASLYADQAMAILLAHIRNGR